MRSGATQAGHPTLQGTPRLVTSSKISVIGLGYVGLPLAARLGRQFDVLGYDLDPTRIAELRAGRDRSGEVPPADLAAASRLHLSHQAEALRGCDIHIIAVPTPVDAARQPDLSLLRQASETVGRVLAPGQVVVFESTVYPGATEEVCAPILEATSGLRLNQDFALGYSPERINPGDPSRRLADIVKVVAASTPEALERIAALYGAIIPAGIHRAPSIRVAEAAKVIENVQRDVNIALMNELAMLLRRLGLESRDVFAAAASKWNFHRYEPGLVGGHCIGVDPYYLAHKAAEVGHRPELILAGRRINDGMAAWLAADVLAALAARGLAAGSARLLVAGFTFKENCADIRNTKVAELVALLRPQVASLALYDPLADPDLVRRDYGLEIAASMPEGPFEAAIVAVGHSQLRAAGAAAFRARLVPGGVLYDLKNIFPIGESDIRV